MKQLLSFFLLLCSGCNSAQNNPNKISGGSEPFEITYSKVGVRFPQSFLEYVLLIRKS
ncbi:MAG: hypothetical protein IPJ81_09295 [Chitinophagaceae bacterium]|nr:hypothetical protein [Chitinophagaceae bacterium]